MRLVFACSAATVVLSCLMMAGPLEAQTNGSGADGSGSEARVLRATKIAAASPELDGRLDEPAWRTAAVASGFVQREPVPGATASERTEVRVLYDGAAIYVGMRLYDSHSDSISAQLVRRDAPSPSSDWADVFIDSYHDRRTAFQFSVTPRGSRVDVLHSEDTNADTTWDATWDVATSIDARGWTAEFRIPLSQLRYSTGGSGTWGIQFGREIARKGESSYWAAYPPTAPGMVSLFGDLVGMEDVAAPRRVEIAPYTLGRLTRTPGSPADPFWSPSEPAASAGADVKVGLTSDLTLTATINPDFGQVEADPSVVNLSSFETFYPERRPFFTEGSEIFSFPMIPEGQVFYSRRVGRPPHATASAPTGGFVDAPEAAHILGAAKLSGKTAGGWSLGALAALTGEAFARVADSAGILPQVPVEPLTTYAVLRAQRDFRRGRSGIGGIATITRRQLGDSALAFLREGAYVGGVNGWHRFGRGRYELRGWLLGTWLQGSAEAISATQRNSVHRFQRPDADHLTYDSTATSLTGWASELYLRKIGGGHWTWYAGGGSRSPGSDVNDVGFQSYADVWYVTLGGTYRQFQPGHVFRNWTLSASSVGAWTFGQELVRHNAAITFNGQFNNLWGGRIMVDRWRSALWPWELRGGPALRLPAHTNWTLSAYTNRRSRTAVEATLSGVYSEDGGGLQVNVETTVSLRPSSRAAVSLAPRYATNREPAQYIRTSTVLGQPHYIMGHLEQRTAALTARVSYLFLPDLSLDFYAQPFLSAGQFSGIREVVSPHADRFADRFHSYGPSEIQFDGTANQYTVDLQGDGSVDFRFTNPDFSVRDLNTNMVLRWEYRPGSILYLVWSHASEQNALEPGLRLGRDLNRLFGAPATDVVLVKMSYWMGR